MTIGQEVKEEDETSHQTTVAEVTLVRNDCDHFEGDQEVIEAENNSVTTYSSQLEYYFPHLCAKNVDSKNTKKKVNGIFFQRLSQKIKI